MTSQARRAHFFIDLEYVADANVAICLASVTVPHPHTNEILRYEVSGTAKRHKDKFDGEVAFKLAAGRALFSLGKKMIKQGNGKVKCNDDNRARRELLKQARAIGAFATQRPRLPRSRSLETSR